MKIRVAQVFYGQAEEFSLHVVRENLLIAGQAGLEYTIIDCCQNDLLLKSARSLPIENKNLSYRKIKDYHATDFLQGLNEFYNLEPKRPGSTLLLDRYDKLLTTGIGQDDSGSIVLQKRDTKYTEEKDKILNQKYIILSPNTQLENLLAKWKKLGISGGIYELLVLAILEDRKYSKSLQEAARSAHSEVYRKQDLARLDLARRKKESWFWEYVRLKRRHSRGLKDIIQLTLFSLGFK